MQVNPDCRVENAVILAAGLGARLGPLTRSTPKPLLPVNGTPILVNALECLAATGVRTVTIVVGYLGKNIRAAIGERLFALDIDYVEAPLFRQTNNLISLWEARSRLDRPSFILDGDVFFEKEVLERCLVRDHPDVLAVDCFKSSMTGTIVLAGDDRQVLDIRLVGAGDLVEAPALYAKTLSIQNLSQDYLQNHLLPAMQIAVAQGETSSFYENILADLVRAGAAPLFAASCSGLRWIEIDNPQDYGEAQLLFSQGRPSGREAAPLASPNPFCARRPR